MRTFLILVPFVAVLVSMRQGIVAGLAGGTAHEIAQQMIVGLQLVLFSAVSFGGILVIASLFARPDRPRKKLFLIGRTILASSSIGAVLITILYTLSEPSTLGVMAKVVDDSFLENATLRALMGSADGLVIGGMLGTWICLVDGEATHFTQKGIARYVVWFVLSVCVGVIAVVVSRSGKIDSALAALIGSVLLIVAAIGVRELLGTRSAKNQDVES